MCEKAGSTKTLAMILLQYLTHYAVNKTCMIN